MSPGKRRRHRRDYGEGHVIDESNNTADDSGDTDEQSKTTSPPHHNINVRSSSWPVALYVPNIMGYLRIILSFYGLKSAIRQQSSTALNTWVAASLLDLFDGMAARRLNQCSKFGVLLDILADNILRTIIWIAAIFESLKSHDDDDETITAKVCLWTGAICLEWITMVCSQCNQAISESGHWKDFHKGRQSPFWIEAIFKNNFKNLPGGVAIFGLFVAPFGSYVWAADRTTKSTWPWRILSENSAQLLIRFAYAGRLLCVLVEFWLCIEYIRGLIHHDTLQSKEKRR